MNSIHSRRPIPLTPRFQAAGDRKRLLARPDCKGFRVHRYQRPPSPIQAFARYEHAPHRLLYRGCRAGDWGLTADRRPALLAILRGYPDADGRTDPKDVEESEARPHGCERRAVVQFQFEFRSIHRRSDSPGIRHVLLRFECPDLTFQACNSLLSIARTIVSRPTSQSPPHLKLTTAFPEGTASSRWESSLVSKFEFPFPFGKSEKPTPNPL